MAIKSFRNILFIIIIILSGLVQNSYSQKRLIDDFENVELWRVYKSDGVEAHTKQVAGRTGNAIRFEYDFTKGSGYGGIQKIVTVELPENFQFSFYIRANSPNNNLEIKFLDSTGENVWWMNNRNYTFPSEWTKFTVKKRHIEFAWGPIEDKSLKKISRIEFTIASFNGGKGWIELDDIYFEELPSELQSKPEALIKSSTQFSDKYSIKNISDDKPHTKWLSTESEEEKILIDFQGYREIGGFIIDWDKENYPQQFDIYLSDGDDKWNKVYSVTANTRERSYIRLLNAECKYASIELKKSSGNKFGLFAD